MSTLNQSPLTRASSVSLYGYEPDAVIAAIKARHERFSAGDMRPDGRKLGLVIEGGALRAVCSAGGAVALASLGYCEIFDEVYATSAAVMNASYFITNQPMQGISIYFDNCTRREFVHPLRLWKVIDVDYIFDQVATREKPLDIARLLASRSRLLVAMLDKRNAEPLLIDLKHSRTPPMTVLKAAAAMPVFYNRTVDVEGRACMDGGLAIPLALPQAIARGCTDILVLSTRPIDYATSRPGWFKRLMFNIVCARGNAALNRVFLNRDVRSREARELALGLVPPPAGVNIATILADAAENIPRLTTDRAVLRGAALSYGRKTLRVFGADAESWSPFD